MRWQQASLSRQRGGRTSTKYANRPAAADIAFCIAAFVNGMSDGRIERALEYHYLSRDPSHFPEPTTISVSVNNSYSLLTIIVLCLGSTPLRAQMNTDLPAVLQANPVRPIADATAPVLPDAPSPADQQQLSPSATAPEAALGGYYGPDRMMQLKGHPVAVPIAKAARDATTAALLWSETEKLIGTRFDVSLCL